MPHVRSLSLVSAARRLQIGGMTRTTYPTFRSIASLGAVLLVIAVSGAAAQEARDATICVDVDVRFTQRHPDARLLSSLQDETAAVWGPYGVRLGWPRPTNHVEGCTPPQASFVVLINAEHGRSSGAASLDELGSTRVIPGVIDHAPICINQETTEQVLAVLTPEQLTRAISRPWVTLADVGRALGRVLAHELGHVLLAAQEHQRQGLMRPSFSLEDLVAGRRETFTLSPPEVDHLRERLFRAVMPTYRAPLASLRCGEHVVGH